MRKIAILMVLMTILAVMTVSAVTDGTTIWTSVSNAGGYTRFVEDTMVGGWDGSETPHPQYTANIRQVIVNDGSFSLNKAMTSEAPWDLQEIMTVGGEGYTEIYKYVSVWTEDSHECSGSLCYPTEAWIEVGFWTKPDYTVGEPWKVPDPLLVDLETVYFLMDVPPAGQEGNYGKVIQTDSPFSFFEKVGINNFPSDYGFPTPPTPPGFFCGWLI